MLIRFLFIVACIAFASCGMNAEHEENGKRVQYTSKDFAENFRRLYNEEPVISSDKLVVDGDSIVFPQELEEEKVYMFYGKQNNVGYQLQLTRLDLTSLKYTFAGTSAGEVVFKDTDTAGLYPLFFLGNEILEGADGSGYPGNVYYADKPDSCTVEIKIAEGNTAAELFATVVIHGCAQISGVSTPVLRAVR